MVIAPGLDRPPSFIARLLAEARGEQDSDRMKEWAERWNAYTGRKDDVLEHEDEDPDDNVLVPYEQLIVNKGRSFLFGKGEMRFTVEQKSVEGKNPQQDGESQETPEAGSGENATQTWLDEVWKRNWKKTLLLKLATNGGVFGHCAIKVINEVPYPRLVNLDPVTLNVEWDEDDIEKVNAYELVTNRTDDEGREIIHKERIEREEIEPEEAAQGDLESPASANPADTAPTPSPATPGDGETTSRPPGAPDPPVPAVNLAAVPVPTVQWVITHYENEHDNDEWVIVEGPDVWPFVWSPVIDCQNLPLPNEYWGMSDIEASQLHLIRSIDRLLSNLNRIIRLHAHPFLYVVGLSDTEVLALEMEMNPDSITALPNPESDLRALEMQSDLGSSITLYLKVKELLHECSRIPEVSVGKTENVGALSGVALEILYGPLAEATDDKHCTYGDMLIELNRRLLDLGGFGYENWVLNEWPDTIPKDRQVEIAQLIQLKTLGASEETLLAMAGLDPKKEKKLRAQEAEENMKLNMTQMSATQAVTGETPQDAAKEAAKEQRDEAGRGSTPPPTQFGRNASR